MKSLHTRLDYRKDEVLKFTAQHGQFGAMNEFDIRSYDRFNQWLKEVTGDENFGLCPTLSIDGRRTLGEQLVDAFLLKVAQLQAEKEELRAQVEMLKRVATLNRRHDEELVIEALEVCQG